MDAATIPQFRPAKPLDGSASCPCGSGASYDRCCRPRGDRAYGTAIQRETVPVRLEGTRTEILSSLIYDGKRFRILWNRLYWFPPEQTFHEFLDYLVLHTLNREWFKRQGTLAERHIVYRWRESLSKLLATPPQADGSRIMTGPVMAYFCFGWDLYWLQLIHRLPKSLVRRLRDHDNFQGARYEVAIAAIFARAGFEIELLDETEKSVRHCEFVATHKRTGGIVYVETKSRHRPGVLNQPGAFDIAAPLKGDLFGLYADAVGQAPSEARPYFIFLDANVPSDVPKTAPAYGNLPLDTYPWMAEFCASLRACWAGSEKTPETAVFVTNSAAHFGNDEDRSPTGVGGYLLSPNPRAPLAEPGVLDDIDYCLRYATSIPRQF